MKVVLVKMNLFVCGVVWILGGLVIIVILLIVLVGVMFKMDVIIIEKSVLVQMDQ